jgi:hypothetical protein
MLYSAEIAIAFCRWIDLVIVGIPTAIPQIYSSEFKTHTDCELTARRGRYITHEQLQCNDIITIWLN